MGSIRLLTLVVLVSTAMLFQSATFAMGPEHTGSWYNPNESGHGFSIEYGATSTGTPLVVVYWYVYDKDGSPVFLTGTGYPDSTGVDITFYAHYGMKFGVFDPSAHQEQDGGVARFNFQGANNGTFEYFPSTWTMQNFGHSHHQMLITKLFGVSPPDPEPPPIVTQWVEVASLQGTANLSNGSSSILNQGDGSSIAVYSGPTWDAVNTQFSCLPVEFKAVRVASGNKLSELTLAGPIGLLHPNVSAVGDFDGNGELDVFFGHYGCDRTPYPGEHNSLLFSRGGVLGDGSGVLPPINALTHSADAADVRGIGVADIMVTNNGNFGCNETLPPYVTNARTSFTIGTCHVTVGPYLLRGNRNGTFTYDASSLPDLVANPPTWPSPNDDWLFNSTLLADVTGDGMPDLVLGTFGTSSSAGVMFPNDGFGGFRTTAVRMPTPLFGAGVTSVVKMRLWTFGNRRTLILSSVTDAYRRSGLQFLEFVAGTFRDVTAEMMPGYANKFWIQDLQVVDLDLDGCPDLVLDGANPAAADKNVWFCRNEKFVAGPQPASHMGLKPVFVDGRPMLLSIRAPLGGPPPIIDTNVRLYDLR